MTLIEIMIALGIIALLAAIIIPNMIRARMAANEAATIAQVKKFGTTEELYRRTDWDGNGVFEYAQNIGPNGGNGNGESLYQCIHLNLVTGLEDDAMVSAEVPKTGITTSCVPRTGYLYFVQLGTSYPTVTTYVNNAGQMILGYAIDTVPGQYDLTGRNRFQMNTTGSVYKSDNGTSNLNAAYNVNVLNGWTPCQE
jgi:type II secretory pathway pseudopilin PulG